jgi:DNA polymerase-3 subunit alpha
MDFSIELIKASDLDATRLEKTLRKPLTILKGVGAKAVQSIIANRPYKSLKDFLTKVDGSKVNSAVFKTLVNAGCFPEEWKESHASLLKQYEIMRKEIAGEKKARKKQEEDTQKYGGGSLFDDC